MESWLFLNIVIRERASCSLNTNSKNVNTIFQLFSRKYKALLIGRDPFFVLDFGFYILDGVGWLDFESDGFTRQGLDEDLHCH